jgi:hypothetical protein
LSERVPENVLAAAHQASGYLISTDRAESERARCVAAACEAHGCEDRAAMVRQLADWLAGELRRHDAALPRASDEPATTVAAVARGDFGT